MPTPSATGSGRGGTVFAPPNQPEAANAFASVLTPEVTQSISGLNSLNQTPASLAYPYVQQDVLGGIQSNPYALAAQNAAQGTSDIASFQTVPTAQAGGGALAGLGGLAAGQAPATLAAGGNVYSTLAGQAPGAFTAGGNVYDTLSAQAPGAFAAGQGTFDYLRSLAPGSQAAGQSAYGTLTGLAPGAYTAGGNTYGTLAGQVPQTLALGGAFANNAFDPQSALFNRTQQQLIDQSNAVNSMSGVANTPYGASLTNNALGNFDINWQTNQLARQQAGLAGLEGANTSAGNLLNTGTGALYSGLGTAGNLLTAGTGALNAGNTTAGNLSLGGLGALTSGNASGAGLLEGGANTLFGGNTSGANLYGTGLNALYGGNTSLGNLISGAQGGYGGATGLYGTAGQQLLSGASAPYNTSIGIQGNNLSGLNQLVNLGNQNYALPASVLSQLSNYMGLGQQASGLANQIGSTNFNQLAGGIGGIGSLLGSGLGFGSPSNPGYLANGLSYLTGGGGYGYGGTGGLY